jgi:two-component sensor histidine kinase
MLSYDGKDFSIAFARDISERRRAEADLLSSLQEKEVLLREIHHRVKNNLAVIGGLIRLQLNDSDESPGAPDHPSLRALAKTRDRILVMGMVHSMLYHDGNLSRINLDESVEQLVGILIDEYEVAGSVTTHLATTDVTLNVDSALPIMLIANEAITNALTHAVESGQNLALTVTLELIDGDTCRLAVRDNGPGLGPDFRLEHQSTLGFSMMSLLAQQVDATLHVENDAGTAVYLTFTV